MSYVRGHPSHLTLRTEAITYTEVRCPAPQGGARNAQQPAGPTLDAPSYGVTWGGLPMFAKRAMTVGVATAGRRRRRRSGQRGRDGVAVLGRAGLGHRPRARRRRATPRSTPSRRYGGTVRRALDIINAFTASVPTDRLDALRAVPGRRVGHRGRRPGPVERRRRRAGRAVGSLHTIANEVTGASTMWDAGYTGQGVDVAVIDSGVVPVEGLDGARQGRLRPRPDPRGQHDGREEPRHLRPRHAHGRDHRRRGPDAAPRARRRNAAVQRHGAGRAHREHQGRRRQRADRRLAGHRGHRLGGPEPAPGTA